MPWQESGVRGQLRGVGSLFPSRESGGFNSGCQAGQQFPLPTEPFNLPRNLIFLLGLEK